MPGRVGQRTTSRLALLNCTQPSRGKSPAIQHNRAFCKMQPVANRVGLVSAPLHALRVRRRVGYVLRPGPDNSYVSAAIAAGVYSGAMRKVALIPARPAGLPAAARTALLVPAEGSPASRPPRWGSPKSRQRRIASADFSPLRPVLGGKRCPLQHKLGSILRKIGRIWSSRPSGDHKARYGIGEHVISTPFPWNAARQSSAKRVAFTGSAAGPTTIFFRTLGFNCLQSNSLYLTNS